MKKLTVLLLTVAALAAVPAHGGKCTWVQMPTSLAFNNYSVYGSSMLTADGSYSIDCTPNTNAIITFSTGTGNPSGYVPRYMTQGTNKLPYNVYDTADAGSNIMGDGTGGTTVRQRFNSTPGNKTFTDPYFGRVTEGSDVPFGTYSDTITVTVSWGNGSISATFTSTVNVLKECTMSGPTKLEFSDYDPVVTNATNPLDQFTQINVTCTMGTQATLAFGNGGNFSGGTRRLAGPPTSFLNYGLFRNSGRTQPWWAAAPDVVTQNSTGKSASMGFFVYGRVPGGQDPSVGLHSDTVLATLNY